MSGPADIGNPRAGILGRIRSALDARDGGASADARFDAAAARVRAHGRNLLPARADGDLETLADRFVAMAEEADATVERVADLTAVPGAVARYLRGANLPPEVRRAPDSALDRVPWDAEPLLGVAAGGAVGSDAASVTGALCGVAETGTLMLTSGAERPTTLNFLPEHHVVLLGRDQLVGSYEAGWDLLRRLGAGPPRTVNLITGPSRSADIEQTLQLGAHGPRRLHIVLVEDTGPEGTGLSPPGLDGGEAVS